MAWAPDPDFPGFVGTTPGRGGYRAAALLAGLPGQWTGGCRHGGRGLLVHLSGPQARAARSSPAPARGRGQCVVIPGDEPCRGGSGEGFPEGAGECRGSPDPALPWPCPRAVDRGGYRSRWGRGRCPSVPLPLASRRGGKKSMNRRICNRWEPSGRSESGVRGATTHITPGPVPAPPRRRAPGGCPGETVWATPAPGGGMPDPASAVPRPTICRTPDLFPVCLAPIKPMYFVVFLILSNENKNP